MLLCDMVMGKLLHSNQSLFNIFHRKSSMGIHHLWWTRLGLSNTGCKLTCKCSRRNSNQAHSMVTEQGVYQSFFKSSAQLWIINVQCTYSIRCLLCSIVPYWLLLTHNKSCCLLLYIWNMAAAASQVVS